MTYNELVDRGLLHDRPAGRGRSISSAWRVRPSHGQALPQARWGPSFAWLGGGIAWLTVIGATGSMSGSSPHVTPTIPSARHRPNRAGTRVFRSCATLAPVPSGRCGHVCPCELSTPWYCLTATPTTWVTSSAAGLPQSGVPAPSGQYRCLVPRRRFVRRQISAAMMRNVRLSSPSPTCSWVNRMLLRPMTIRPVVPASGRGFRPAHRGPAGRPPPCPVTRVIPTMRRSSRARGVDDAPQ